MGALSLTAVVVGLDIGANAKPSGIFTPIPTDTPTTTPTKPGPSPTVTAPTTTPTPKPTPSPTKPNPKPTTSTPKPKPTTPTPKPTPPPATTISHQSAVVNYRFGSVQLTVTKTGSTITDITMDLAGATNGRGSSFPYLISLAITAQSGSFDTSMMSGATYSTNAFMQALNNALSKF